MKSPVQGIGKGWRELRLGDLGNLKGGGTPSRAVERYYTGNIPWITIKDLKEGEFYLEESTEHITPEAVANSATNLIDPGCVLIATRVGLGKVAINKVPVAINQDVKAMQPHRDVLPEYLLFLVYKSAFDILRFSVGTTVKGIRQDDLLGIKVVLPSVPVQERIVQILRKVYEMLRKRREALALADAILPAAYRDLFGDPEANPHGWSVETLDKYLEESRYGTSEKAGAYNEGDPVLRIPNVIHRTIDTSDLKYLKVSDTERKLLVLRAGDVLVVRTNGNKDYVGRCAVFDKQEEFLFASYLIRLRVQQQYLNPHYVVAFLSTPFGRREIDVNSRTSAGQYNISSTGLRSIRIPVPPMPTQLKFLDQYEQWKEAKGRLELAVREAGATFAALLAQAFTGKLTAEWERINAEWISSQVKFHEGLPRLILLAFIKEAIARKQRAGRREWVLVTALMKYAFLSQLEGKGRYRIYNFVPYHYGPFAKELYGDLERLAQDGVIEVENDRKEDRTRISLKDDRRAVEMLSCLPAEVKEDVGSVLDGYGALDHKNLLKAVYEKYPAYGKKSKIKKKSKKSAEPFVKQMDPDLRH